MKPVTLDINSLNNSMLKSFNNAEAGKNKMSFADFLADALHGVNNLQKNASASAVNLLAGEEEYLHNVMLAYEKANLALQLTVEVRDKIIEAYHELMRMQM